MENIESIIKASFSYSEMCRKLNWSVNSKNTRTLQKYIKDNKINVTHLDPYKVNRDRKLYTPTEKNCPICSKVFIANVGQKREKTVCSRACSNTYFRSGKNNPNWKSPEDKKDYRSICFEAHKKECIVCKENLIVAVHHYDENHDNNSSDNLIPLCPTHHQYWHSKYKYIIEDQVNNYIIYFKSKL